MPETFRNRRQNIIMASALAMFAAAALTSCGNSSHSAPSMAEEGYDVSLISLQDTLQTIADGAPGEVGIALITSDGDTVLVNNEDKYPLMSVFKLHQAVSLCRRFDEKGTSLDSIIHIRRAELNPHTWSPMLKDFSGDEIEISVRDMLRYTLTQSDNNASNYMFANIQTVEDTDSCITLLIPRDSFRLSVTEADMWSDHSLCYRNHSSPLGAALLISRLFDGDIAGSGNSPFIRTTLSECLTGTDRIAAPLKNLKGVSVAHKTGSGFRDADGTLSAHNDVGFVTLPDGRRYTLAVLVKDFKGSETEAAAVIARISATVYDAIGTQL